MERLKLSESDENEKRKFITMLDSNLCEKIYSKYRPYHKIRDTTSHELKEGDYKIGVFLSGWEGRDFYFKHGKNVVDIIITISDSYECVKLNFPDNWGYKEEDKFKAKHDRYELSCKTTELSLSIIPTILEKDLISLYEFQGKVDCILYNKIQSTNLQIEDIITAFKNRRISLIKIEDIFKDEN